MKKTFCLLIIFLSIVSFSEELKQAPAAGPANFVEASKIEGLESNVVFKDNKLVSCSIKGTGIVTSKPDNVYIEIGFSSEPSSTMKSAENDLNKKTDFLIRTIGRLYGIKKESFKMSKMSPKLNEQIMKVPKALQQLDAAGNPIEKKENKYYVSKSIVINDLGKKKMSELMEIIDKCSEYGATVIAEKTKTDDAVLSESTLGTGQTQLKQTKGMSKLNIKNESAETSNELINYFFKEETLEKMTKDAKAAALKEIQAKMDKVNDKVNVKAMDQKFTENLSSTTTEEGELTVTDEVMADFTVPGAVQAPTGAPAGAPGAPASPGAAPEKK